MKTVHMVICDDCQENIETISEYAGRICMKHGLHPEIRCFHDGDELLDHYPPETDFLYLDVEMPFVNGIDAAKELRDRGYDHVCIVFISNYKQYAISGYQSGAWRYLLKPLSYETFEHEIQPILQKVTDAAGQYITVHSNGEIRSIPVNSIYYAEVNERKNVDFVLKDMTVEVFKPLSFIEKRLQYPSFFRCHNSFMINFDYVTRIAKDTVEMKNGVNIPLSRHRKKEFLNAYIDYIGDIL